MPKNKDLKRQRFGRLMVVEIDGRRKGRIFWNCICDCGLKISVRSSHLTMGKTQSCGCLGSEVRSHNGKRNKKHGKCKSAEYGIWAGMKNRCNNLNNQAYRNYGGKNIRVCIRWSSFEKFYEDMGNKPFTRAQIDRKNNEGDYEPSNCKWSTSLENNNNRSNTLFVEYNGEVVSVSNLARKYKINYTTLLYRLQNGLSLEESLIRKPSSGSPYKNPKNQETA